MLVGAHMQSTRARKRRRPVDHDELARALCVTALWASARVCVCVHFCTAHALALTIDKLNAISITRECFSIDFNCFDFVKVVHTACDRCVVIVGGSHRMLVRAFGSHAAKIVTKFCVRVSSQTNVSTRNECVLHV